jgi:hypothetical protein
MNLCRGCNTDFGRLSAFDAHRTGRHAYTFREGMRMDPPREDGRRCLDEEEMEARGFVRNAYGRWSLVSESERTRLRAIPRVRVRS